MLRHSTFAIALVLIGSLTWASSAQAHCHGNGAGGSASQGQPIYVQNNARVAIWVAASYIPPGSNRRVQDGYWRIAPGQRLLILYNNGVWLYLGARLEDGTIAHMNGNPIRATIRGLPVDLYPFDTGEDFDPRVITLYNR
jgi:hypothetical protein